MHEPLSDQKTNLQTSEDFFKQLQQVYVSCQQKLATAYSKELAVIKRMKNKFTILLLIGIVFCITNGCSVKWTEAIRSGGIAQNQFRETVDIEIHNGLIFLPIIIEGKKYRFLFDSGAPFSISNELQNDLAYKIVSKGNIIDSDHNRKKVMWAQVDAVTIGDISFTKQTAFIGDFDANPILKCLEIDGIIGSNLIRHCNWTIDQQEKSLTLFNSFSAHDLNGYFTVPFKTDYQYNMYIDINLGQATVRNVLVDYGSNGSISLNDEIFTKLKNRNIIGETRIEKGMQNSGIVGKTVNLRRESAYSDSVSINDIYFEKVMLGTGKTVSIGNKFLSRFNITIDWNNKNLHLLETTEIPESIRFSGFRLGYSTNQGVYVQSVVENSNAYNEGIRPNMKVAKIDRLDFENGNDFCDYVNHKLGDEIFLQLVDSTGNKLEFHIEKTSF